MSAVNSPGATVLGEMVNVNINSFISGNPIDTSASRLQTGAAVTGGVASYGFSEATDSFLKGTGTKGKAVGTFFKFVVESGSNAVPNFVE